MEVMIRMIHPMNLTRRRPANFRRRDLEWTHHASRIYSRKVRMQPHVTTVAELTSSTMGALLACGGVWRHIIQICWKQRGHLKSSNSYFDFTKWPHLRERFELDYKVTYTRRVEMSNPSSTSTEWLKWESKTLLQDSLFIAFQRFHELKDALYTVDELTNQEWNFMELPLPSWNLHMKQQLRSVTSRMSLCPTSSHSHSHWSTTISTLHWSLWHSRWCFRA